MIPVLLCLAVLAQGDEELRALAAKVRSYPAKFQLIAAGRAAAPALLDQLGSSDRWIVFESESALRWIARRAGEAGEGRAMLDLLLPRLAADQPAAARRFAVELLGELASEEATKTLAGLLGDEAVGEIAWDSLARIPGPAATGAMLEAVRRSPTPCGIRALGQRRDARVGAALVELASGGGHRAAAIEAMGACGELSLHAALADLVRGAQGDERKAAFRSLLRVADAQGATAPAGRVLATACGLASDDAERLAVLEALLRARGADALPCVEELAKSEAPEVQAAAWRALAARAEEAPDPLALWRRVVAESGDAGALMRAASGMGRVGGAELGAAGGLGGGGGAEVVGALAPLLGHAEPSVREAAAGALLELPGAAATEALAGAIDGPGRALVLEALGRRRDPAAVPALAKRAESGDEAAYRALGAIGDPSAAEAVLQGVDFGHAGAKEACLEIARATAARDAARGRAIYHELLDRDPAARVVAALAPVADATSVAKVEPLAGAEASEEMKGAAMGLYGAVAGRAAGAGSRDEAVRVWRKALELGSVEAERGLRELGEPVEVTAREGRVSAWWVMGPFPARDRSAWETREFPEDGVDLAKEGAIGERVVRWRAVMAGEDGRVDLDPLMKPNDRAACYATCEVIVKKARQATLRSGSDDGLIVWVNGERVHAVLEPRSYAADQDRVVVQLREGTNRLLLKVLEIGGDWSFGVRLEDEAARPLKFKMR
jgi:hypothetical protein